MLQRITIDKLIFGGQGLGRLPDGKACFVWNALPGETVDVEILEEKKRFASGTARAIITSSPDRITAKDTAFLATSPWEIMTQTAEDRWKRDIAIETYGKIGDLILTDNPPQLISSEPYYGYRNKQIFRFTQTDGRLSLAVHARGSNDCIAVSRASIARDEINDTAEHILSWLQEKNIPATALDSLLLRCNTRGEVIAGLFVDDANKIHDLPGLTDTLKGVVIFAGEKQVAAHGETTLTETLLGSRLDYGLQSFFQINPLLFETALTDIAAFLQPKTALVDLYSGVGAISVPLGMNRDETILVESNAEAVAFAKDNIAANGMRNASVILASAEHATQHIHHDKQLVIDPPRAGLDTRVTQAILKARPPRIAYLSCNISTQARDIRLLSHLYVPRFVRLYNFFPRTPHIEGLVVLERR